MDLVNSFPRGYSWSTFNSALLGQRAWHDDIATLGDNYLHSQEKVLMQLVKNESGGTLTPGEGFTWKASYWGSRVGAASGDGVLVHGVVDHLHSGTVAANAMFWAAIYGPHKLVHDGNSTIDQGDRLVAAANGEFNEWSSEQDYVIAGVAWEDWAASNTAKYAHLRLA